jgi:hypothetical protein
MSAEIERLKAQLKKLRKENRQLKLDRGIKCVVCGKYNGRCPGHPGASWSDSR